MDIEAGSPSRRERAGEPDGTQLFETAFAHSPIGIALLGLDGHVLRANRPLCALTGWPEAELLGRSLAELTHPDDRAATTLGESERRLVTRDGMVIWGRLSVSAVSNGDGRPHALIAQIVDITAARRAAAELAASHARLQGVIDHVPFGISVRDADGRYVLVNRYVTAVLEKPAEAFIGRAPHEVLTPEQCAVTVSEDAHLLAGGPSVAEEYVVHIPDGSAHDYTLIKFPIVETDGSVSGLGQCVIDITERKNAERALAIERRALDEAQEIAHVGSFTWNTATGEAAWSAELYRIFGRDPTDGPALGDAFLGFVDPRDRTRVAGGYERYAAGGGHGALELSYDIVRGDGAVRSLHVLGHRDPEDADRLTGTVQDVTELRAAEREAQQQRDRAAAIVSAMAEGYALVTMNVEIREVNDAMCEITGFARDELVGTRPPYPFTVPDALGETLRIRDEILEARGGTFEVTLMRKGGELFQAEVTSRAAYDAAGEMIGLVNTLRDVSDRRRQQAELERLASTDDLTGLANRRNLAEALRRETAAARRHGWPVSLIMLDLDHFKAVNDRHGHPTGDDVLVAVAQRLAGTVRAGETLARLGGEEFGWLLPDCDAESAMAVAERARALVGSDPFPGVGVLTMSAGVSTASQAADDQELYRAADRALYEAKQTGRNRTVHAGG
jgi:diguanylate cyclase (GGDEF)-like protein/PAS domain S-box-containing protein